MPNTQTTGISTSHLQNGMPQQARPYILVAQNDTAGRPHLAGDASQGTVRATEGHAEESNGPLAENPSLYYSAVGLGVAIIIIVFGFLTTRNLTQRNPTRKQTLVEQAVASMAHFTKGAIGPGGEKFTPLVGTVFAFVLVSNLMGALPFVFKKTAEGVTSFVPAPTANLSMTIAISLVVFVVVQYVGIKENGVGGYFKHFMGPVPAIAPLMFPLEIFGALVRPVSLSIRLFGNVFGEETVIAILVGLAVTIMRAIYVPLPFHVIMVAFGVFGAIIQAGVYTILTCAYIALSIGDHDHGHHEELDALGAEMPAAAHH